MSELYHERQSLQLCALHCVNNLLQAKAYTKKEFDNICYELTPVSFRNPHRSMLGTGNYDVNIIMRALKKKGYTVKWFDKRKALNDIDYSQISGLVVNQWRPSLIPFWDTKHWIAYPKIGDTFYDSNSRNTVPKPFENVEELKEHLQKLVLDKIRGSDNASQLLLVYKDSEAKEEVELKDENVEEKKAEESE